MRYMDFRSDTVTKPTDEMREVIAKAEDDASSNALSAYAAEITGKEDAIYTCSGTMGNLLAFLSAGHHGESVLAGVNSHVWCAEVGGMSAVAGLCPYPLDDASGVPQADDIIRAN